jgi:hypothetical protein
MTEKMPPYTGMMNAGHEQYHGVCSLNEHGEITHARKLAEVALREKLVNTEQEAVAWANHEIGKLHSNIKKSKVHRIARMELRAEAKQQGEWSFQP